jgi:hypothetical protein
MENRRPDHYASQHLPILNDIAQRAHFVTRFVGGGQNVCLHVPTAAEADWAAVYLAPYASKQPEASVDDLHVFLSRSKEHWAGITAALERFRPIRRVAFYLYRVALLYEIDGWDIFVPLDERIKAHGDNAELPDREIYLRRNRQIYLVVDFEDGRSTTTEGPRVVREAISRRFLDRGDMFFHASAIEWRGLAYAFAGRKGSGKSTILLEAITTLRAKMIANDRSHVSVTPSQPTLFAWPTVNYFFPSTLASFGIDLVAAQPAYPQDAFWRRPSEDPRDRKIGVLNSEIAAWLHADTVLQAPLRAMFLIDRQQGARERIEPMKDTSEIADFLLDQNFMQADPQYPDPFGFATERDDLWKEAIRSFAARDDIAFLRVKGWDTTAYLLDYLERDKATQVTANHAG